MPEPGQVVLSSVRPESPSPDPVAPPPAPPPAADGPEIDWRRQRIAIRPPNVRQLPVPEVPRGIEIFLWSKVYDEAILADLCMERAYQIVEKRAGEKRVGIDHFPMSGGGSGSADPGAIMSAAVPLGVELYRRIAPKLESEYREDYEKVVTGALPQAQ